jgi:hypothetical protein
MRGPLQRALLWAGLGLSGALLARGVGPARAEGYHGVSPGSSTVPDGIAAQPGGPALVTWPGFQQLANGGSRVFVQTSVPVTPSLKREGSQLHLILPGVSLPPGNARLPLDTSFFNTPVRSVRAKLRKGEGVVVEIELRGKSSATPNLHSEKAQNGYFFVYVDFPAGSYK